MNSNKMNLGKVCALASAALCLALLLTGCGFQGSNLFDKVMLEFADDEVYDFSYEDGEDIDWSSLELSSHLPRPSSLYGYVYESSDECLDIRLYYSSQEDFSKYLSACQEMGFIINYDEYEGYYEAYNEDGLKLELYDYTSDGGGFDIVLFASMIDSSFIWPDTGCAGFLPAPNSNTGTVYRNTDTDLTVYVGDTSLEDYIEYKSECKESGFDMIYSNSYSSFSADDEDGNWLSIEYIERLQMMIICLYIYDD